MGCNLDRYVITKFALPYRNHHFVIKNTEMAKNLRFDVGTNSLLRCAGVTFGAKSNQKRGGCDSPAPLNAEYVPYYLTNTSAIACSSHATRTRFMYMSAYSYFISGEALHPLLSPLPHLIEMDKNNPFRKIQQQKRTVKPSF